jgi:hypothetical protein
MDWLVTSTSVRQQQRQVCRSAEANFRATHTCLAVHLRMADRVILPITFIEDTGVLPLTNPNSLLRFTPAQLRSCSLPVSLRLILQIGDIGDPPSFVRCVRGSIPLLITAPHGGSDAGASSCIH